MSEADLVIRGDVVTPDRVIADSYVAVSEEGETIESVGEGTPPAAAEVQDCAATGLFPASSMAGLMPPVS